MKGRELNMIANKTHSEPFCPMSTSPKHLFMARFNNSNDCVNRMGSLLEGNIVMHAERVTRVHGILVRGPKNMNFPAVANTAILKFRHLFFWGTLK
jgi:hypothetical protein